jgi:hypothetical protein
MRIVRVAAILAAFCLMGCSTIDGAKWVITKDGVYQGSSDTYNWPKYSDASSTPSADTSVNDYNLPALYAQSVQDPLEAGKANQMLMAAYALIDDNCEDYFQSTGTTQRWIFVTRDAVGAVGTIATGVMGALGAGTTSIAWVGLSTGTAYSGLDIFTKHFLFAADNIDAVHKLVREQLLADQDTEILTEASAKDFTFYKARRAVFRSQDGCSDAHILTLVRDAITKGAISASEQNGKDAQAALQSFAADSYQTAAANIGAIINTASSASPNQMEAILWLYQLAPSKAEEYAKIDQLLGTTKTGAKLVSTSAGVAGEGPDLAAVRGRIESDLNRALATPAGQERLDAAILAQRAATTPPPPPTPPPAPAPALGGPTPLVPTPPQGNQQ